MRSRAKAVTRKLNRTQRRRRRGNALVSTAGLVPYAALVAPVGYLTLLTAAAWRAIRAGEHRTATPSEPRHRFLIAIPAHNEEKLIADALSSIRALDYPRELVRTHVVADNCTDATTMIAAAHGAEVYERVAPHDPGKGPALQSLLRRAWADGADHDAVVIMDADSLLSPNFLRVMDAKLAAGAEIVQSHYAVRDAGSSSATAFRAAALAARHYLRPLGRSHLGASAGLYGNGMVFRDDVLRTRTWSHHLTEDIEFQLECLLDGTPVAFAPDAVVEAEMPTTLEASQTQHERWERGRLDMVKRFVPALLGRAVTGASPGRVRSADAAADQLVPPFSLLVMGTGGLCVLAVGQSILAGRRAWWRLPTVGALVALQGVYVLSALWMVDAPPEIYRSLLSAPRQVLWKARLWSRVLARRDDVAWVRTARNAEAPE
jgi:cellulose synthase/poly-beta-1,6-N-acetylglucosamine synthase-like glycosyltransferase